MHEKNFCSIPPAKDEKTPELTQTGPNAFTAKSKVSLNDQDTKENPDYDKGYKSVLSVREELLHFLKKYINAAWVKKLTPKDIRPYPNELILPDYESRIPDLVFEVRMNGKWIFCYLIIQMQSSVDFTMTFRFLTEMQGILMKSFLSCSKNERERKEYRVPATVPVLLYNGKNNWTAEKNFRNYQKNEELYERHILDFEYYLVDIAHLEDRFILNSNFLIDSIFYLDKHRHDRKNLFAKLSVVLKRVKEMVPEKRAMFREWMEHVFMLSVNANYREHVKKIIETMKGEETVFKYAITDMIETWIKEAEEKGHKVGLSEGRTLGITEGRTLGITEGRTLGITEGRTLGITEGRTLGMAEGYAHGLMAESVNIIIRKLDQGLSTESIAYWMEKEKDFVDAIARLYQENPKATAEMLVDLYYTKEKSQ